MFDDDTQRILTKDENKRINDFVKQDHPLADDKEWAIWMKNDDGAYWYTVLDDQGFPSDDNVIEGETGEMMYLNREDACFQWGDDIGMVSLDNGLSYRPVSELSDDEIHLVMQEINSCQSQWFPEICSLCDYLDGYGENDREWLEEFMKRICSNWIIG